MIATNLVFLSLAICQVGPVAVPHAEDETSLVRVKADPAAFAEKPIIVCGNGEISDAYQGFYRDSQKSHVSIKFDELGKDSNEVGETARLYLNRKLGKAAIERMVSLQEKHVGERIPLRALVVLKADAFRDGKQWDKLEVLDLQFSVEGSNPIEWQPWTLAPAKKKPERAAPKVE